MRRRIVYVAAAAALATGHLAVPVPAAAELTQPAGTCVGAGTWETGGFTVVSTDADPSRVIEIPRADRVAWSAEVTGPQGGAPRPIAGNISLQLPPPLGWTTVDEWSGSATNVASVGVRDYDLPSLVPAGVVFTLRAEHREGGEVLCTGTARLVIAGGPFDSPLIWVALALLVAFGVPLVLTGRARSGGPHTGRMLAGAALGAGFGLAVGLTLLLFGALPLASPVLTAAPLVGLLAGGGWGRWAPLGSETTR